MTKTDRLADFLASESKDASSVTMDELLVKAEDMTLADHDKIHHPEGYKEGDECKLRDDFKAANAGEELTDPNTELHGDTQVSSEARHSTNLEFGKWLNGELQGQNLSENQRFDLQSKFQRATQDSTDGLMEEVAKAIDPEVGEKILKNSQANLVGYYENTGTDGLQEELQFDLVGDGDNQDVPEDIAKMINTYCCLLGLLRKQDGVSWHTPVFGTSPSESNGVELDIGRAITNEEYKDFAKYLDEKIGEHETSIASFDNNWNKTVERKKANDLISNGSVGLISTASGVRIIDFMGVFDDHADMQNIIAEALEEYTKFGSDAKVYGFKSRGDYLDSKITEKNDKGEDWYHSTWYDASPDNGTPYFEKIKSMITDQEQLRRIKELYAKYAPIVDESEEKAARELGYKGNLVKSPSWK
jgi:hypothetical protein